ncbi:MAG TPA: ABC transporter permease [Dehalococcoidia bacterium]|nr:ABC transporter permease [Dehalococcoidia bacterium]
MNKTLLILKHEFRKILRSKTFIILTLALPLLLILGFGVYKGVQEWHHPAAPEEVKIGYVDEIGMFDEYTNQSDVLFVLYQSEDAAKQALLVKEIKEYFIIPPDYLSSGLITRYTMAREAAPSEKTRGQIADFLISNLLSDEVSPQIVERAKTPMLLASIRLDESGEIASGQDVFSSYVLPMVFVVIFMISIFFSSGTLFQSVTEEKENRMIEILLSSVSTRQLLVGKVLGLGASGLIQVAVWFITLEIFAEVASGTIPALSDLSIPVSVLAWAVVYFILGYLLFAAIFSGIGSIVPTAKEGQGLSVIFTLPAVLPYYFSYFILTNPTGALSRALTFFPLTSPITAMIRISTKAIAPWEIALSIVIIVTSVVVTMWVAAKLFRVFLLMYGKRPALREIVRYLREA